jgi:hypothetical protein
VYPCDEEEALLAYACPALCELALRFGAESSTECLIEVVNAGVKRSCTYNVQFIYEG